MTQAPVHGLVLSGGASRRMGQDKARLMHDGKTLLERAVSVLQPLCEAVYVASDAAQVEQVEHWPHIPDIQPGLGPMAGLVSAQRHCPEAAWLLLAVDMPAVTVSTLERLLAARNPDAEAVAFCLEPDGKAKDGALLEPCCALYEPTSAEPAAERFEARELSLMGLLTELVVKRLPPRPEELLNVNTPEAWAAFQSGGGPQSA